MTAARDPCIPWCVFVTRRWLLLFLPLSTAACRLTDQSGPACRKPLPEPTARAEAVADPGCWYAVCLSPIESRGSGGAPGSSELELVRSRAFPAYSLR